VALSLLGPGESGAVVSRHNIWIPLVVTGLVIGAALIAVCVGLQRAPAPHLPVTAVGGQLTSTPQACLGDSVRVTRVSSIEDGAALVRNGDAIVVVGAAFPTTPQPCER